MLRKRSHLLIILVYYTSLLVWSCNNVGSTDSRSENGKELSKIYCAGCHAYPEPTLATKEIWEKSILPKMALRLGLGDTFNELSQYPTEEIMAIAEQNIFPNKQILTEKQYQQIIDFYLSAAPAVLPQKDQPIVLHTNLFSVHDLSNIAENVICTQFIGNNIAIGTKDPNLFLKIDRQFKVDEKIETEYPVVYFDNTDNTISWLEIGKMDPTETTRGKLVRNQVVLKNNLKRPVFFQKRDMNTDGIDDWLIANFGNEKGDLSYYDGLSNKKEAILELSGTRIFHFGDLDLDGQEELIVLVTQETEKIFSVIMKNGTVESVKEVLSFPPIYGSSYFDLHDFNNDGRLDIIMTNGDNADLSSIFKPYHGVRIFINNNGVFNDVSFFYPINGASKVVCNDFDNDGDSDFLTISFFPQSEKNESVLFFENNGSSFKAKSIAGISNQPWLTVDATDFDSDGDIDIILGSYQRSLSKIHNKTEIKSLVYLSNNSN